MTDSATQIGVDKLIEMSISSIRKKFIEKEFLTGSDLIEMGIAKNASALFLWRKHGGGPKFIIFPHKKIRYFKDDLFLWLKDQKF